MVSEMCQAARRGPTEYRNAGKYRKAPKSTEMHSKSTEMQMIQENFDGLVLKCVILRKE